MIISIVNLKGGAGKTTLATNLVFALSRKAKTLLIDTDMQRSASIWYNVRESVNDNFSVISIAEDASLKKQIPEFKKQYEHIIIDGAPQSDRISAICIYAADLVIIPVMPSPYDLWATASILERVKTTQEIQPNKKAYFVLNRVNDQAAISRETAEALESLGCPIFKTRLHSRVVYADSAASGQSVLESGNAKAKAEFEALYTEVEQLIK